jgi:hypothetical protein
MFDDFNDYNFQNKLKIISYNEISKYNKTLKKDIIKLINSESLEIDLEGNISKKYWNKLLDIFPEYQLALVDINKNEILACCNCIPFVWDSTIKNLPNGWDDVIIRGFKNNINNDICNTLSGLYVIVNEIHKKKGYSLLMLKSMKYLCKINNLKNFVVPIRPLLKHLYPLI